MRKLLKWLPSLICIAALLFHPHSAFVIMPFGAIGTYACQRLQTDLVDFYGRNSPQFRTLGSVAFVKWLLSPQNTAGFQRINVESIPGKKRGVAFLVDLPFCYQLCALDVDCTTSNVQYIDGGSQEMVFDLTNPAFRHCDGSGRPVKLRFKEADLMKYCTKDDTTYIKNKIARYLFEFEENLDKLLTLLISTQVGTDSLGNALVNIPLFVSANQFTPTLAALNPEAGWYIDQVYQDAGFNNQYAVIGGTIANKYANYLKIQGVNYAGVDMSKLADDVPYTFYDRNFNSVLGSGDFLQFAPGAVQLVTWNKYKGEKARAVTDLYTKGTVTLPTTGLEVDYKWFYDYDCEEWVFEAFLYGELAVVPAGGCGTGSGVNGVIRYHDCGTVAMIPHC